MNAKTRKGGRAAEGQMRKASNFLSLIIGLSLLLILLSSSAAKVRLSDRSWDIANKQNPNISSVLNIDSSPKKTFASLLVAGGGGGTKREDVSKLDNIPFRWGLRKIHAPEAWKITQGSEQITVAVIDSGIDHEHPALQGKMWVNKDEIPGNGKDDDHNGYIDDIHGWDFRDDDNDSLQGSPLHWHGTFVAGLIGASIDESGRAGVAPQVKLMDIRFLDSRNLFHNSDWNRFTQAINYAADNGADIINLSIYCNYKPPSTLKKAIQRAVAKGIIVVGITGNNSSAVQYPGKYKSVMAVTAIDKSNQVPSYSNFGPEVTVAAPGDGVGSTIPGGKYIVGEGTSFAAAHVTGTIALLLSVEPGLGLARLHHILGGASIDLGKTGRDEAYGYGLIDAYQALSLLY